jgi:3-deoxy-manno-octulosonate cytidylyltransferase (CMP-KDO synthetase)
MKVIGIIPARYDSSRLPGKPLADICGKPMIWWVYQQVKQAEGLDEIYVATDDERIAKVCEKFDIHFVMTKNTHPTAFHRLQEVSEKITADFYLQINGDEPLIKPETISLAIPGNIPKNTEFGTNIITQIKNPVEAMDSSNIKVVFDNNMYALYMSRTPIPYPYGSLDFSYYKHVGVIGLNKKMLDFYANSTPGRLETIEEIGTLRFIDYNKNLLFIETLDHDSLSVDYQKDLDLVRQIIGERK